MTMHAVPLPAHTPLKGGQYRVQQHIATGGFGAVYLATNAAGARFAIKETYDAHYVHRSGDGLHVTARDDVPGSASIHERQRKRAREEFLRFSHPQLQHPALVPLLDCFEDCGSTYLVMPHIAGQDLRKAAAQRRYGDPAWVLQVLRPIGEVLALLHRHGLIHRDLKPDNIIVCSGDNGALWPVVLDTGSTRDYARRDLVNTGIKTDFGPPEIASAADARIYGRPGPGSDCFAMAGMACLLLSGVQPPGNEERAVALARHDGSDPLRQPRGMSDAVWLVLQRSLQLQVAERHASAGHFLAELEAAMQARAVPSEQPQQLGQQVGEPRGSLHRSDSPTPPHPPPADSGSALPKARQPDAIAWCGALMALGALLAAAWLVWDPETTALAAAAGLCLHLILALALLLRGVPPAWALFPVGNVLEAWRLPGRPGPQTTRTGKR